MCQCKKDVTPLLRHRSYAFLALTHRTDDRDRRNEIIFVDATHVNWLTLGRCGANIYFPNSLYRIVTWVKLLSYECCRTLRMVCPHWIGCFWANVDPYLCRHMAWLDHSELNNKSACLSPPGLFVSYIKLSFMHANEKHHETYPISLPSLLALTYCCTWNYLRVINYW